MGSFGSKDYLAATQQETSVPQVWLTLSVLAFPEPTALMVVLQAGHICAATLMVDLVRIPFGAGLATLV